MLGYSDFYFHDRCISNKLKKKMLLKKIKYTFYKNYKMLVGFFIHILTHLIYLIELFFLYDQLK